jgi:2-methylcitrate dehydratase
MKNHTVKVYPEQEKLAKEDQLAWKMAQVAVDDVAVDKDVTDMIINRVIDNASVAIASLNRGAVTSARAQATAHKREQGAQVFGLPSDQRFSAEWAAWANGTAVRELDYHDTFLAADYSHPADNIPPILAVAQQCGKNGHDLVRGLATGYELHVNLVKGICLHKHKIDHIAHLCPAAAAGIGTMMCISLSSKHCMSVVRHDNPVKGKFQRGRPMRQHMRVSLLSRLLTVVCAARGLLHRYMKVRIV